MSQVFPLRTAVELDDNREPRLLELEDEMADDVFSALSSKTARTILSALHDSPQAASDLAEVTDTSVQNVQYHMQNLTDVDLVEVVDTWYSERGTEMKVYAPTDDALVLFTGDADRRSRLKDLLKRAIGIVGVLAPVAALFGWFAARLTEPESSNVYAERSSGAVSDGGVNTGGGDGADAPAAAPDAASEGAEAASDGAQIALDAATNAGIDPMLLAGAAFFIGGAFVLTLVLATWYWREG